MIMKKQIRNLLCKMLCMAMAFSVTACSTGETGSSLPMQSQTSILENSSVTSEKTSEEKESSEVDSGEQGDGGNQGGENSGDQEDDEELGGGSGGLGGEVSKPDPEKVLDREETDALGHKIAYYKDGTWEDLGRVTPLDFTPKAMETRIGYQALGAETQGQDKQGFYAELFHAALDFSQSGADLVAEEINGGDSYVLATLDGGKYALSTNQMQAIWRTMRQDCPEFYWLSTQVWLVGNELWVCINEEYADGERRADLKTKIELAALECDSYLNGKMSETELAVTINDYLTANVTYAYEADGVTPSGAVWAHNIAGWAEKDLGVCETYAESYAYLCGLFGLECWTVVGVAAQTGVMSGHAWNILKLDGEWHNVDVTWNDGFETSSPEFLTREWFGVGATEFSHSHLADSTTGVGMSYQVQLPNLSEKELSPVLLKEDDQEAVMVSSIDKAFEKMTNAGGRYEITLYPDSNAQVKANKVIYPQKDDFTTATLPNVEEITIVGERYVTNAQVGSYIAATLQTSADILLQSDLCLVGFDLYANSLNLGANTLVLADDTALQTSVVGAVGSLVEVSAGDGYATAQGIHVDTLELVSGSLYTLNALTAQTTYLHSGTLLVHQSAANITIANLLCDYAGANIITTATTGATMITLGNIGGIDGLPFKSLMLDVRFTGMENYPQISVTGDVVGLLILAITGTVSAEDKTPIQSSNFNGNAVAAIATKVTQKEFLVGFTENGSIGVVSYIYDSATGMVRVL